MATAIEIIPATVPITVTNGDTLAWTTTISVDGTPVDLTEADTEVLVIVEYTNSQTNILTIGTTNVLLRIAGERAYKAYKGIK